MFTVQRKLIICFATHTTWNACSSVNMAKSYKRFKRYFKQVGIPSHSEGVFHNPRQSRNKNSITEKWTWGLSGKITSRKALQAFLAIMAVRLSHPAQISGIVRNAKPINRRLRVNKGSLNLWSHSRVQLDQGVILVLSVSSPLLP